MEALESRPLRWKPYAFALTSGMATFVTVELIARVPRPSLDGWDVWWTVNGSVLAIVAVLSLPLLWKKPADPISPPKWYVLVAQLYSAWISMFYVGSLYWNRSKLVAFLLVVAGALSGAYMFFDFVKRKKNLTHG